MLFSILWQNGKYTYNTSVKHPMSLKKSACETELQDEWATFFHGPLFLMERMTDNRCYAGFDIWQMSSPKWIKQACHLKKLFHLQANIRKFKKKKSCIHHCELNSFPKLEDLSIEISINIYRSNFSRCVMEWVNI